jgi:hypothetical protein
MSSISLEASIRTCKVDTGWANKIESDRFLNPNLMVCPVWNGFDSAGRSVAPDSFTTKRAGCNSAEDRVVVENAQRPQYMEYITLDAMGFQGDIYKYDQNFQDSVVRTKSLAGNSQYTGQFGMQSSLGANVIPGCAASRGDAYAQAMTQQYKRQGQSMQNGMEGYMRRQASGF